LKPLKSLAGQTAIYGFPSIVGRLLNYLLVPLYTYNFVTKDFGTVTALYAYISFFNIILTYGMETSLFNYSRLIEDKKKVYGTILNSVIITSILFLILVTLFRSHIADWAVEKGHPEYMVWAAMILSSDAISAIAFAKLREQNKARKFAIIKSINIFSNILFNIFFIALCPYIINHIDSPFYGFVSAIYNPDVGIGYIFLSNVISSLLTLLILVPDIFISGFQFDLELWKRIMPYAMPLLMAGLAGMVNETLDRIMLNYMIPGDTGKEQIGIYGACYKISIIITMFIQAFRYASEPFFFANSKEPDFNKLFGQIMRYFIILCLLIFLFTTLNLSWIQYFVGHAYRSGLGVVSILLIANICLGVFYTLSIWYKLNNKTMYGAYLTIFGAIITIALNLWWIPIYGYMGCAWATLICYASTMLLSYFLSRKEMPVNYRLGRIGIYFSLSLALYFFRGHVSPLPHFNEILFNNSLIFIFIVIVLLIEKPSFTFLKK
jgi:O-antigen/teichoic acid export membrane protein